MPVRATTANYVVTSQKSLFSRSRTPDLFPSLVFVFHFPPSDPEKQRADGWRRVPASGIDTNSAQPRSRKMENKRAAAGVNELLMAGTIRPVSRCDSLPTAP